MHSNIETREAKRLAWLKEIFDNQSLSVSPVAGDASFRQYYRVKSFNASYILMDAPPTKEDCKKFVDIDEIMAEHNIPVPQIFYSNYEDGFLILEDFGDVLFAHKLNESPDKLYKQAIDSLIDIQKINSTNSLPKYDKAFIEMESERFETWFLQKLLGIHINAQQHAILISLYELFENIATQQPQTFVHRDYHSRNLLLPGHQALGIIDFQDAISGPISYDLVSLLKDCYVQWPRNKVLNWLHYYLEKAKQHNLIQNSLTSEQFIKWFDITGMQRHIKVLGIFSRLALRDHKPAYLEDMPRVLSYIEEVIELYSELDFFKPLFELFNHHFYQSEYAAD